MRISRRRRAALCGCTSGAPQTEPVLPLDDYRQKVLRAARRGNVYPYELTGLLAGPEGQLHRVRPQ